jgi:hypothetical protein
VETAYYTRQNQLSSRPKGGFVAKRFAKGPSERFPSSGLQRRYDYPICGGPEMTD